MWELMGEDMSNLNSFTPNLKFTYESSKKDISFLVDLKVSLNKGKLSTDLHIKSTDYHQCLHYPSGHPKHIKQSIIYSQQLHVSRICSREDDFNPFLSNVTFLYPLKTSENHRFSEVFREYRNVTLE